MGKKTAVRQQHQQLFGTNGIRGVVNDLLTPQFASEIGIAIGTYCEGKKIAVGTDARTSNEMLKNSIVAGILSTGCSVEDLGIMPTPVVQFAVPHLGCRMGITLTASHNPPQFNGIKCSDEIGAELMRREEEQIERIYWGRSFARAQWDRLGTVAQASAVHAYTDALLSHIDGVAIAKRKPKVVLDCSNGTTSAVTPAILKRLGCEYVTLNAHMDGTFPGHPSEPTPENSRQLIEAVKSLGADIGIIQDGDGDRTIFVDEKGGYLPGERSLAIIAKQMTSARKGCIVVTPVNSSQCVEDAVKTNGGRIEYTRVGSPSIIQRMRETGAVFGGEEAGGLVYPEFQYAKDGMMTAAKMIEIMCRTGKPLSRLNAEIPRYHVHKVRVTCPDAKKAKVLLEFKAQMQKKGLKVNDLDGVKILLKDGGWVLVRPSGTEPIYRVFVERKNPKESEKICAEYVKELEKQIAACK